MSTSTPGVGSPVHFHLASGRARPAIVTSVNGDDSLNLQVIPDPTDAAELGTSSGTVPMMGVGFGTFPGQWCHPPAPGDARR